MPIQQRARGNDAGDCLASWQSDLFGLGGQPAALLIVEPGLFAQLLLEDFDLLLKVFDNVLLVAVDPARQAEQEELKQVHWRSMRDWRLQGQRFSGRIGKFLDRTKQIIPHVPRNVSFRTVRHPCACPQITFGFRPGSWQGGGAVQPSFCPSHTLRPFRQKVLPNRAVAAEAKAARRECHDGERSP
jgi:hypothetical protein